MGNEPPRQLREPRGRGGPFSRAVWVVGGRAVPPRRSGQNKEANGNPFAVSAAGARGIAQFMPGTAAAMGLHDAFDAAASIDAQGHLMHDLLARFASVPLALAAYNAGPAPVAACGCVPAFPETQAYVARILGLLGGAGELAGARLEVRLLK